MMKVLYLIKECVKDFIESSGLHQAELPMKKKDDEIHLQYTMDWLTMAYKRGRGGVSSHYSLISGKWLAPFPETTGYIIPTFFSYAMHKKDEKYLKIGEALADWLIKVQLPTGACIQGLYSSTVRGYKPLVFNTGQNIFGFLEAYKEIKDEKYLAAANRAGEFLVRNVDKNGIWNKYLHNDIPHTYNSRTAWALLKLNQVVNNCEYRDVAISNLNWVVTEQTKNGWFKNANFKPRELPNTHGIVYIVRGLLESYLLTKESSFFNSAKKTADTFLKLFKEKRHLYTFWDENWENHGKYFKKKSGKYQCLTGNIQLSIVWMKLYEILEDHRYLDAAIKMINFVKTTQNLRTRIEGIKGGIKGAFPVFGSYSVFKYPNWAAKFFADALMMKIKIMERENLKI